MNNDIKQKIEMYVMDNFESIDDLNPNDDGYYQARSSIIKEISTMVELLQKEDVNDENKDLNEAKINNENIKIENDYRINLKKLENETIKNKQMIDLEKEKISITNNKNNNDIKLKSEELKLNFKRDIEVRTDRITKVIVDGVTIIAPIIFYNIWMKRGFVFEETGTYTSNTFKNLISKFRPTK